MGVVAVAYSGGRDSTALLHAVLAEAERCGWRVLALHVHHGLNAAADDWLAHCAERCRAWAMDGRPVDFACDRLAGRPAAGDSVEAWARDARYAALARLARRAGATVVLLGHHRRDQAETMLLQALRGGGMAGLSGMPERVERDGIVWLRPWLRRPRGEIEAYLRRHALDFVEDDSNADPRFARNRLRLQVWPALEAAFPGAETALAASARWAQQARAALAELAAIDLAAVCRGEGLDIAAWCALSTPRRSLALRVWLHETTGALPSASWVERLLDELPIRHAARWPTVGGELRSYRGLLRIVPLNDAPAGADPERELDVAGAGTYALPGWAGRLEVRPVVEGGVPLTSLAQLELRPRRGGETFQAAPGRPARSLKKQFQAAGIPPWERRGPLVYSGDRLVYVPGLGLDARAIGLAGPSRVTLRWVPGAVGAGDTPG